MSSPNPTHDFENVRVEDDIHAPAAPTEDVWLVCSCGGDAASSSYDSLAAVCRAVRSNPGSGWHLGRVGGRICDAGCAGAGFIRARVWKYLQSGRAAIWKDRISDDKE